MNRLVYSVFKAIIISIIFIFIFDMASYLYRAVSLNARMESLSTSLKKVVMENNYLPPEDAKLYQNLFAQMINDFNESQVSIGASGDMIAPSSISENDFISGMHWNYGTGAIDRNGNLMSSSSNNIIDLEGEAWSYVGGTWQSRTRNIVETDMSKPREYGDIQIIQLRVGVYQPLWGWFGSGTPTRVNYDYNGEDGTQWNVARTVRGTEFTYTYYVPCLKYKTTNMY